MQVTTHPDDMTQRAKTIRDSGKPLVLGGGDSFFYYDAETWKYVLGLSGTSLQYGIVENAFLSIPGLVESIKDRYAQELDIEASDIKVIALPQRHWELSYHTIQDIYKSTDRTT
jgi:hypothetical protein